MRKYMILMPASLIILLVSLPATPVKAQEAILEVIKAGVKKVIRSVDLKIQRMQNQTIWLQNAQKVLENQLSKLKLTEIADWTNRQKELYGKYYEELWKVKSAISYYQGIKDLTEKQGALVNEYKKAWKHFKQDRNFSPEELKYIQKVYSGLLEASVKNLDQILIVTGAFKTQMSDAKRLEIIQLVSARIDENYNDLRQFNTENARLSLQRSKDRDELNSIQKLYGIPNYQ